MGQRILNSSAVPNKAEAWCQFINEVFGRADVSISNESEFRGDIIFSPLGNLGVTTVRSSYEYGERTKAHVAKDTDENFVFVLLKSGRLQIRQRDQECILSPGTFTLFDSSLPYVFRHIEPTEVLDVSIPSNIMRLRLNDPHRFVAVTRSAEAGLGLVLCNFLASLSNEIGSIPKDVAMKLSNQIADMIGILLESGPDEAPIGNSAVQTALYRRSTTFIEYSLADPALTPAKIAAAMGISVRYLHTIFNASGETVCDFMRRRRLSRSYDELIDVKKSHLRVNEIAYRFGFNSPTHFASAFKREYGISPRDVRPGDVRPGDVRPGHEQL